MRCVLADDDTLLLQQIDHLIEWNLNHQDSVNSNEEKESTPSTLRYIGGVDISHGADDEDLACAGLVVVEYPSLKEVYRKFNVVRYTKRYFILYHFIKKTYISGFLAFREVSFLVDIIEEMRVQHCPFMPDVILVDGNGILHHRGFGLASHLGVLCGIPTIGIGKNLLMIDGLEMKPIKKQCNQRLERKGDYMRLIGKSQCNVHGAAVRCGVSRRNRPNEGKKAIYVSIGHRISLTSAVKIVLLSSKESITTIPEPILLADNGTRDLIKSHEKTLSNKK